MDTCVIIGGGGHAAVLFETIVARGSHHIVGFVDPNPDAPLKREIPYLGDDSMLPALRQSGLSLCIVGLGALPGSDARISLWERVVSLGFTPLTVTSPSSIVSPSAHLGAGAQALPGSVVNAYAAVGEGSILNTGAQVDHHSRIGKHSHVAPGAVICGEVSIGERCFIGAGAVVLQGLSVADQTIIGAGAVVTRSLLTPGTFVGIPAKQIGPFRGER